MGDRHNEGNKKGNLPVYFPVESTVLPISVNEQIHRFGGGGAGKEHFKWANLWSLFKRTAGWPELDLSFTAWEPHATSPHA